MAYEYDVFISYRRESDPKEWTQNIFLPKFEAYLREESGKKNLKIFLDEQGIEGGDYWEDTLKIALAKSRCLVPVLMPSYFALHSKPVKRIIPIYLDSSKPLEGSPLTSVQGINYTGNPYEVIQQIDRLLANHHRPSSVPFAAPS
ncbi:MAG: TIR domain-containing protein [Saprospiraceae bacterium]